MYYNNYPSNYMPMLPQASPNWVKGLEEVKSYFVPTGGVAALFDSNDQVFYFKEVDSTGVPHIRTFKYEEVHDESNPEYVTKTDLHNAIKELKDMFFEASEEGDK